ncbi:hypothetical protein K438DRAFT_1989991 [Mycena galopus ATCC 62051]|nr:hypothetical protein K438DRAFT_1989991 [Mycena galopus ATCC 62051]
MENHTLTIQDVLDSLPNASTSYSRTYTISDFHAAVAAPVSPFDAPGYIYWYRILHPDGFLEWKAGRSSNPLHRLREWRRQCYLHDIQLIGCIPTRHATRLESVVHHYFKLLDAWHEPYPCTSCGVWHQEKFHLGTLDLCVVSGEHAAIRITELLQAFVDQD